MDSGLWPIFVFSFERFLRATLVFEVSPTELWATAAAAFIEIMGSGLWTISLVEILQRTGPFSYWLYCATNCLLTTVSGLSPLLTTVCFVHAVLVTGRSFARV